MARNPMHAVDEYRLQRSYEVIKKDLDVKDVIGYLFQEGIIDVDDKERISQPGARKEQVERLLDMLPCRGEHAFQAFCDAMREKYHWLVERLRSVEIPSNIRGSERTTLGGSVLTSPTDSQGFNNITRETQSLSLREASRERLKGDSVGKSIPEGKNRSYFFLKLSKYEPTSAYCKIFINIVGLVFVQLLAEPNTSYSMICSEAQQLTS